jgi:hypothetical protein
MRRAVGLIVGVIAVLFGATPAVAYAPTPTPAAPGDGTPLPTPGLGQAVCTISDPQMTELSGLVATPEGYVLINDSNSNAENIKVFFVDQACRRRSVAVYPPRPRDPEDLALQSDGTLWVADTGDDLINPSRPNIALWKVPPGGAGKMTLFRFQYPDGPHDCEALLLAKENTPIFVTKVVTGPAGVYVPDGALDPSGRAVPLKKVGQFQPQRTGTDNPLGVPGQNSVTGGANAPDGKRVALRTYADAYEWDVPDGDVVKAITTSKPRITPLPREPQGEGIAYTPDGASFLTVADQLTAVKILRYKPATTAAAPAAKLPAAPPGRRSSTHSWFDDLSLRQIMYLVAGVGVLGLVFVLIGIVGICRSRRDRRLAALGTVRGTASVGQAGPEEDGSGEPVAEDYYGEGIYGRPTVEPERPGGTVYGGQRYDDGYDRGGAQPGYGQPPYPQGYDDFNPRSDYTPRR